MTITPRHAKTIKALVDAHRDWADAVLLKNDTEASIALRTMKQVLDDYWAACPICGAAMLAIHAHDPCCDGVARTLRYCPGCGTTVQVATRNE